MQPSRTTGNFEGKIIKCVMDQVDFNSLYPIFNEPMHDIDHKHFLVRFIITDYIHIKCTRLSKIRTMEMQDRFVRHRFLKQTHQKGQ